ncbi:uncharacterized protein EI90DRAFT_713105 [Cantharellus anzutake]|uniref:uncharacterized protein n=1 Tax=Cantharellus anzutake TaxID=1750568 RepID=UPI001904E524|nr:uncharacterized protein EI90DRAFT_713105 [Cantharellus anzutake]KAF8332842.1 hypothetical protein EI90DRAFT_713105 [Cantharellus anzutake]
MIWSLVHTGFPENQNFSNPTGVSNYSPPLPSCSGGPEDDTEPTSPQPGNHGGGGGKGTKTAAIVGGVVGGVAGLVVIGAVAYIVYAKRAARGTAATPAGGGMTTAYGAGMTEVANARTPSAAGGPARMSDASPFAELGVGMSENGAAPGMGASAGSGSGAAGSRTASDIIASIAAFPSEVPASAIPSVSMDPEAGGYAPRGGARPIGIGSGFTGADSEFPAASGSGAGARGGGGAGGSAAIAFGGRLFGMSDDRPNDQEVHSVREIASVSNDTSSLLHSLGQPPPYSIDSTPQSPENISSRDRVGSNTPWE